MLLAIPLLGEFPDYLSIIGYVVIFAASFYMFKNNSKELPMDVNE